MQYILNAIRGALIGMAELVPGISGGTVALIVGIYERAVHNANDLISGRFKKVEWSFLISVAIGMFIAVFGMSTVLSNFV
ncbi:undecaprenyl phosphate translocase family protein, partial [uncultured Corynebacterium sp.]